VLCQVIGGDSLRNRARKLLTDYRWSDAAHQAVFETIVRLPQMSRPALRDQLPALLTRRGFPDFDFEALFAGPEPSASDAEEWMRRLAGEA